MKVQWESSQIKEWCDLKQPCKVACEFKDKIMIISSNFSTHKYQNESGSETFKKQKILELIIQRVRRKILFPLITNKTWTLLTQAWRLLPPPPQYFIHAETFIIYQKQPEEEAENFSTYYMLLTILMFV